MSYFSDALPQHFNRWNRYEPPGLIPKYSSGKTWYFTGEDIYAIDEDRR